MKKIDDKELDKELMDEILHTRNSMKTAVDFAKGSPKYELLVTTLADERVALLHELYTCKKNLLKCQTDLSNCRKKQQA